MRKHVFRTMLALVFCVTLCLGLKAAAYAESGTWGNLSWTLDSNGNLTISGNGEMDDFYRDSYSGDQHTWDRSYAWRVYTERIKVVEIRSGVTSIGEGAFADCSSLTSVTIPDSVSSIAPFFIDGCGSFEGCSVLARIEVASANPYYCDLDGVLFNKNATEIIYYPEGRIGEYVIPSSVTTIGEGAFAGCTGLASVSIPDSVTSIGDWAFSYCTGLTSVTIPGSVTYIGDWTFEGCSGLTSAGPIGSGCDYQFGWTDSIPSNAVSGCSGLTSITIPDSVTSIAEWAFDECTSLQDVYYSGTQEQWQAISIGSDNDPLTGAVIHYGFKPDFILPAGLTEIGEEAFAGGAFTYVKLSDNADMIWPFAFADGPNLAYISIPNATAVIDENAFGNLQNLTILGKSGSTAEAYATAHGFTFVPAA